VMLSLNHELVSRAILRLWLVFSQILSKIRNFPKIFLRSFENVGPDYQRSSPAELTA